MCERLEDEQHSRRSDELDSSPLERAFYTRPALAGFGFGAEALVGLLGLILYRLVIYDVFLNRNGSGVYKRNCMWNCVTHLQLLIILVAIVGGLTS